MDNQKSIFTPEYRDKIAKRVAADIKEKTGRDGVLIKGEQKVQFDELQTPKADNTQDVNKKFTMDFLKDQAKNVNKLFTERAKGNKKIFDLVTNGESGKWTVSKKTEFGNQYEQIPSIILTEYKITSSSSIQSLRRAVSLIPDVLSTAFGGAVQKSAQAVGTVIKENLNTKLYELLNNGLSNLGDTFNDVTQIAKDLSGYNEHPDIAGNSHLDPYKWLYSIVPTNYSYILPYFSDDYFNINNIWSENAGSSMKESKLKTMAENLLNMPIDLANSASFFDPGIYVERPKFYNFEQGRSVDISVTFPLINTHKFEDIDRNLQIIKNLVIQNLPYRVNQVKSEIPVIYDVKIPGAAHYPFCYIKQLTIKHLGNKRVTKEFNNGTPTIIPDAYMINIKLESLTDYACNFYIKAFGNNLNGINVNTHLMSVSIPDSSRIAKKLSNPRSFEETLSNTRTVSPDE